MNSKAISGNKQVSATNLALERAKVRVPPPKEFVGEGEKVTTPSGNWRLCTHPESRALFLPGAKSWHKTFKNVGKDTLVKGFGGRTRGGTGEGQPKARGPGWAQRRAPLGGAGGPRAGRRGTRGARARCALSPGPAFPSPARARGAPASKLETRPSGAESGSCPRAPLFPHPFPRSWLSDPQEALGGEVALRGRESNAWVERKGQWRGRGQPSVRAPAAGGRAGGETRAPAPPSADPGEQALQRKAPALGDDRRTSPPPRVLSASGAPPPVPVPSCAG